MENASKALIIAGAILLSILIISLGIAIFGQASGVVNNNAMSEVEVTTFNSKFTQYEGSNVRGGQVNSLLNQIVQNNVTYKEDTSRQITIATDGIVDKTNWQGSVPNNSKPTKSSETGRAMTGKVYEVSCDTDQTTGLVTTVTIKKVS